MAKIQFASGRTSVCALSLSNIVGELDAGLTYYFWVSCRNDCGWNLPGPISEITTTADSGIEIIIPEQALIAGENWLQYAVLVSETTDVADSKVVCIVETESITLPYTINLTKPVHLETERVLATAPTTDLVNGLLYTESSSGNVFFYSSSSNSWKRHYEGYNIGFIETTDDLIFGCDTALIDISESRHIINYDYSMNGQPGKPRKYWLFNNTSNTLEVDRQIGLTTTIQDQDVSSLFYGLFKVVFEGYFDRATNLYIDLDDFPFSYLNVEQSYEALLPNLKLEKELLPQQAFQFSVFPEFSETELGLSRNLLPIDSSINLLPFLAPNVGRTTDLGDLLGDTILGTDTNLRRVYPTVGLSAFVDSGISVINGDIARVKTSTTAFGFQSNQASQILAINSSGTLYPLSAGSSLRVNEKQRALVSTVSGESKVSEFSNQIEANTNPVISIDLNYPTNIRVTYPDVIGGSDKGDFNAEEIVFYVRKRNSLDGEIVETRRMGGFIPTSTTEDSYQFLYEDAPIYADALPSVDFGLYTPEQIPQANIELTNTTGGFFFDIAVSFKYNGATITSISHAVSDGCVVELVQPLDKMASQLSYWQKTVLTLTDLSNLPSTDLVDLALYPVVETSQLYMYRANSTDVLDIEALNGTGRFKSFN